MAPAALIYTKFTQQNMVNHMLPILLYLVAQSCPTLCDPRDCRLLGSDHGILRARILEWVAMSSSRGSSHPRDGTQVSSIAGGFFTIWATREAHAIGPMLILYISTFQTQPFSRYFQTNLTRSPEGLLTM